MFDVDLEYDDGSLDTRMVRANTYEGAWNEVLSLPELDDGAVRSLMLWHSTSRQSGTIFFNRVNYGPFSVTFFDPTFHRHRFPQAFENVPAALCRVAEYMRHVNRPLWFNQVVVRDSRHREVVRFRIS